MNRKLCWMLALAANVVSPSCNTEGQADTRALDSKHGGASDVYVRYEEGTPEAVVAAFFAHGGIADKEKCYTGEMLEHFLDEPTLGETLPDGVLFAIRPLAATPERRPFAVLLSKDDQTQDWYAYAREEHGVWKLEAVRCLALTEVPYAVMQQLEAKPQRTADEEWEYQNLLLSFMSDADLRAFLIEHMHELDAVVALLDGGRADEATAGARALHLRMVRRSSENNVELTIGAMVDNSVGFLFVPEGSTAPTIDPSHCIYVEPVIGRWCVFKAT